MSRSTNKKVFAVYPDGREINITDEFNHCLENDNSPFLVIYDSVVSAMGAESLRFQ